MLMAIEEMLQERRGAAARRARVRGRRCHVSRRRRSTGLVGPNFSRLCATQMEGMGCTEAVGLTVSTGWLGLARETPAPPSVCRALHVRFWPLGRDSALSALQKLATCRVMPCSRESVPLLRVCLYDLSLVSAMISDRNGACTSSFHTS